MGIMPGAPQPQAGAATPPRGRGTAIFLACSMAAFGGAVGVLILGTIVTDGTYGSRMAWLVGVVLPLLLLSAGSAGWVRRGSLRRRRAPVAEVSSPRWVQSAARSLFVVSATLFAIPVALALALLLVYAALIAAHAIVH